jgi:hypothetical protein
VVAQLELSPLRSRGEIGGLAMRPALKDTDDNARPAPATCPLPVETDRIDLAAQRSEKADPDIP